MTKHLRRPAARSRRAAAGRSGHRRGSARPPRPGREPAVPSVDQELAALCRALGHPARVQILRFLIGHGTCYFGSLSDVIPRAASTVSQHLAILEAAGLVEGSADRRRTCYCVVPARLDALKRLVAAL